MKPHLRPIPSSVGTVTPQPGGRTAHPHGSAGSLKDANPWSLSKGRPIRRLLVGLAERMGDAVALDPADGGDPDMVSLCHVELRALRACVFRHGQRGDSYGIFFEFPHPVPGILESEENLSLPQALASLALHFDA
jgi:hypothetical protein